jgi:hypothetical protein
VQVLCSASNAGAAQVPVQVPCCAARQNVRIKHNGRHGYVAQCFTGRLINALCVPSSALLCPVTHFYNRRMLLLPTPNDFVELVRPVGGPHSVGEIREAAAVAVAQFFFNYFLC